MNSQPVQRGAVAESMVCTWAIRQGYIVSFPARGLSPRYDLILDNGVRLHRIQVKRAHRRTDKGNELRANLVDGNGGTYDDLDNVAVVDVDTGRIWLIPTMHIAGQKTIGLTTGRYNHWMVCDGRQAN